MKIAVVFTGGTIGSSAGEDGLFNVDQKKRYRLLEMFREEKKDTDVEFETFEPYLTLSEHLNGDYIQKLIDCVGELADKEYDGIIVTHGTDTLQYSAAALGYAFGNDSIPIVLVSSNYILEDERMNGLANFIGAVDFIKCQGGRGTFVSYKNTGETTKIHRGTRLRFHATYEDAVESIGNRWYGNIQNGSFEKNPAYQEETDAASCLKKCWSGETSRVQMLITYPGIDWNMVSFECDALLLQCYHSGTLNTKNKAMKRWMEQAKEKQLPVYLVGINEKVAYESGKVYEELGVLILPAIAPIAAYVKIGMAIASGCDLSEAVFGSLAGDVVEI